MSFDLSSILKQYIGNGNSSEDAVQHFDTVSQNVSPAQMSQGVSEMMRSDQTPVFGQLVGQLFNQATPEQKNEMLRQLIANMSPDAQANLANNPKLSSVFAQLQQGDLSAISTGHVEQVATHAQQNDDSIVDKMSSFYAQHTGLLKTLGGAALSIGLAKIANNMKSS